MKMTAVDDGYKTKVVVTTTIQEPTEAFMKMMEICKRDRWTLLVVGDSSTPHESYQKLGDPVMYLHPDTQERVYKAVSDSLGWRTIQRRNIGFLDAYRMGADVIATWDDDNIPYDNWGRNLYINKTIDVDTYESENGVFDPLSVTNQKHLWHRGYPIEGLPTRDRVTYLGKRKRRVLVQADLWDGDPDIDAMARLQYKPCVKFDTIEPYASVNISPFNSQNTFLAREVLPFYAVLPYCGRMDDIWGGYLLQMYFNDCIIYNRASVYQDRNPQDLITNLQAEIIGYRNTSSVVNDIGAYYARLDSRTRVFWEAYTSAYGRLNGSTN